jgi:hypothetical protein
VIDIFVKNVQENIRSEEKKFFSKFFIPRWKKVNLLKKESFYNLKKYVRIIDIISKKNKVLEDLLSKMNLFRTLISKNTKEDDEFYENVYDIIKNIDLKDFPFKTVKTRRVINNYVEVESVLFGEIKSFVDYNLLYGQEYILLETNGREPIFFQINDDCVNVDLIFENKSEEYIMNEKEREEFKLDHNEFIASQFEDIQCFVFEDDPENFFIEKESEKAKAGEIEKSITSVVRMVLSDFVNIEKKEGEGKLGEVKNLKELAENYKQESKYLDNYFYIIRKNGNRFRRIFIVSDLHGSKEGFVNMIKKLEEENFAFNRDLLIFLGDYVDRGEKNLWVLYHVLNLKRKNPESIILLKGNHEYYEVNDGRISCLHDPHDFYSCLHAKILKNESFDDNIFSEKFIQLLLGQIFREMPVGVFLILREKNIFISHSGFTYPKGDVDYEVGWDYYKAKIDRYSYIEKLSDFNKEDVYKGFIWTRMVSNEYKDSTMTLSKEVGRYCQNNFLEKFKIDTLIRGHEHPKEGIEILNKDGKIEEGVEKCKVKLNSAKVITIFSGGGYEDSGDFVKFKSVMLKIDQNDDIDVIELLNKENNSVEKKKKSETKKEIRDGKNSSV